MDYSSVMSYCYFIAFFIKYVKKFQFFKDDLFFVCSGILIQQWKPLFKGNPIDIELVILAHNIEVQNRMTSGVVSKDMVCKVHFFFLYF